jgi:hypothetical protein
MGISFTMQIVIPPHVLVRTLESESVLLNMKDESYYGLDEMGTRMWIVLTQSENIQVAYESLLAEYQVNASILQKDLEDLIEKLVEHGLVKLHSN